MYNALDGFEKFLNEVFHVDREKQPALVKPAANLLIGGQLKVGETQKKMAEAKQYLNLIKSWQVMATQINRYNLWSNQLLNKKEVMTPRDWEVLQRASAKVLEAKNEILDIKDDTTLADLGAADDLKSAYSQLAYLGSRYKVWKAPEELTYRWLQKGGSIHRLVKWLQEAEFVSLPSEEAAVIERYSRLIGDAGVLFLAVIVAILIGLTQIYFDKTFGTLQDYLTLIFIGGGSQVVVKGLVDTITQLRSPLKA